MKRWGFALLRKSRKDLAALHRKIASPRHSDLTETSEGAMVSVEQQENPIICSSQFH